MLNAKLESLNVIFAMDLWPVLKEFWALEMCYKMFEYYFVAQRVIFLLEMN